MSRFLNYFSKRKRDTLYFVVSVMDHDVHTDFFGSYDDAQAYKRKIEIEFGEYLKDIAIFESVEVFDGKNK